MSEADSLYSFVFKGLLTEEALDRAGRHIWETPEGDEGKIAEALSLAALDDEQVSSAKRMAIVYTAIAAFENSVRELISKTLLEEVGEDWWNQCVSKNIRDQAKKRKEEEEKIRWHSQRGAEPINYTMLPNLIKVIRQNHSDHFEPFIPHIEWAENVFDVIERSRNVIMHSGILGPQDIARLGIYIRDWTTQVAT